MNNVEELHNRRIHEEAVAIERVNFTKTDRLVNPIKVNPLIYQEGNIPILITAPHSVRYIKQKKIRVSDEFTGATALLLKKLTGCHILAVSKLYGGDPNTDKKCFYKESLSKIIQSNKIRMVIDLHGCSRETGVDISVGILKEDISKKYQDAKEEILSTLSTYGYKNVVENAFKLEENSISRYVTQELHIHAFQLEVNKKYRVPHQNGQNYCKLLSSLIGIIYSLKNKI